MVSNISWKNVMLLHCNISYCDLTSGTVSWFFKLSKFVAAMMRIAMQDLFAFAFSMIAQVQIYVVTMRVIAFSGVLMSIL